MKRFVSILCFLWIAAARGAADDPPVGAEQVAESTHESGDASRMDAWDAHDATREDVDRWIAEGRPEEAEAAILRHERDYAGERSARHFYSMRMKIGEAYFARGEHGNALRLFEAARPDSFCGNCQGSQYIRKRIRVARVHESRLNFPAAFLSYLRALPATLLGGGLLRVAWGLTYTGAVILLPINVAVVVWRRRRAKKEPNGPVQDDPSADGTT